MGMLPRFFKQGVLGEVDRTQVGPRDGTAEGVTRNDPTTEQVAAVLAPAVPRQHAGASELASLEAESGTPLTSPLAAGDSLIAVAEGVAELASSVNTPEQAAEEVPQASHLELADDGPQIELADDAAPAAPRLVAPRRGSYGDSSGTRVGQPHAAARKRTSTALGRPMARRAPFTPLQRVLLLDTWRRSGLPARDFAPLVGVSTHTLYAWKKRFDEQGPAGLDDQPRGQQTKGSRLPEVTKRTILMLKESHPEWGCQRISDLLARGPALPASASAVARVLHEVGYEAVDQPTHAHPDQPRRFERARPNQLWQTDLFSFVLKRQNRRVYLVAFMDDHSRFIVSFGLHASQSAALVIEVLEAALANYGVPEEILTDNGAQYITWRGKSQFSKQLEKRAFGIWSPSLAGHRRWARSNGFGELCGATAWKRRSLPTWMTRGAGSGYSSIITISFARIRRWKVWYQPIVFSKRRPRCCRRSAPACPPTPWNWPVTASRASRFIWRDNWTASRSACIAQGIA
jgi:transposase InsO family protein